NTLDESMLDLVGTLVVAERVVGRQDVLLLVHHTVEVFGPEDVGDGIHLALHDHLSVEAGHEIPGVGDHLGPSRSAALMPVFPLIEGSTIHTDGKPHLLNGWNLSVFEASREKFLE